MNTTTETYPPFFIDGKINPALIDNVSKNNVAFWADHFKKNSKLNINQLRKFYDSFIRIYNSNINIDEKKVQLLMLKANSEYSAQRLNTKIFAEYFSDRLNIVLKQKDDFQKYLNVLKLHLEALVAYYPKN